MSLTEKELLIKQRLEKLDSFLWNSHCDYWDREECDFHKNASSDLTVLLDTVSKLREALEKIADPRKRDHREPDSYTELGCVMHIAATALEETE